MLGQSIIINQMEFTDSTANKANKAPPVDLEATDESALKFNNLNTYTRKVNSGGK